MYKKVSHWLKTLSLIAYKQTEQSFKSGNEDIRGEVKGQGIRHEGKRDNLSGMWVAETRNKASGVRVSWDRDKVRDMGSRTGQGIRDEGSRDQGRGTRYQR